NEGHLSDLPVRTFRIERGRVSAQARDASGTAVARGAVQAACYRVRPHLRFGVSPWQTRSATDWSDLLHPASLCAADRADSAQSGGPAASWHMGCSREGKPSREAQWTSPATDCKTLCRSIGCLS